MKRNNNPLIFLFGPTGVGKTALLESFFSEGYSVVNADSKQIYRHLDLGSAKPEPQLVARIPHYIVDILEPWEEFSVGQFVHRADSAVEEIRSQGRIPVVSGGTAFYFKHFLYGLPESPKSSALVRREVGALVEKNGLLWAHEELSRIDPVSAAKIHQNDTYRITRALEVYRATGHPLSSFSVPTLPREGLQPLIIGLERDKEELAQRIRKRVDLMEEQGLMREIEGLIEMGATAQWPGMQGIGYREYFTLHETGEFSVDTFKELIVRNSIRYAKRQMTFFRSLTGVSWIHPDDAKTLEALLLSYLS